MKLEWPEGTRGERASFLATELEGFYPESKDLAGPSPTQGGRKQAREGLHAFDVSGYAARRNHVLPDQTRISRLSPYIRHGVLTLREVAESVRSRFGSTEDSRKFWSELGWREFWQLVYRRYGEAVYSDLEPAKVPLGDLPLAEDIATGRTGLVCMDAAIRELLRTGLMHNHARMWVASYVVHVRKVDWRAGERWFYQHLLDGDPASNTLSWQWVASTFSHKPYFFNRENVEKYAGDAFCRDCRGPCPFDDSYEALSNKLFGERSGIHPGSRKDHSPVRSAGCVDGGLKKVMEGQKKTLVWLHGDSLSPEDPAILKYPDSSRIFIFDQDFLKAFQLSFKRLFFLYECVGELDADVVLGCVEEELLKKMSEIGAGRLAVTQSVSPRFRCLIQRLQTKVEIELLPAPALVSVPDDYVPQRFGQFWKKFGQEWQ